MIAKHAQEIEPFIVMEVMERAQELEGLRCRSLGTRLHLPEDKAETGEDSGCDPRVDLSDKNLELSFMGGVLTMKIEQSQRPPLLEAPSSTILEAEPVETTTT